MNIKPIEITGEDFEPLSDRTYRVSYFDIDAYFMFSEPSDLGGHIAARVKRNINKCPRKQYECLASV